MREINNNGDFENNEMNSIKVENTIRPIEKNHVTRVRLINLNMRCLPQSGSLSKRMKLFSTNNETKG